MPPTSSSKCAQPRLVAGLPDPRRDLGKVGAGRELQVGALAHQIDMGVEHAGRLLQRLLDMAHAGRASHSADAEIQLASLAIA